MKFAGDPASFRVVPRGQRKQVLSSNPDRTLHELNDMRFAEKYEKVKGTLSNSAKNVYFNLRLTVDKDPLPDSKRCEKTR